MAEALSVLALFVGVLGFIALGLRYGYRYVDRMLMADGAPPFRPCVFYHEEDKITEILLKDCFTVWCPLQRSAAHFVDLGYDQDDNLVGIRIWADVREPQSPTRPIYEGAELLRKLYHRER